MYVNFLVHIIGNHANDTNILGRSVHTIKKNTEALVIAGNETGLEVSVDKTKYMVMSRDQNAGRSHDIKIALKGWNSSDIWEQPYQIKILFRKR